MIDEKYLNRLAHIDDGATGYYYMVDVKSNPDDIDWFLYFRPRQSYYRLTLSEYNGAWRVFTVGR